MVYKAMGIVIYVIVIYKIYAAAATRAGKQIWMLIL